jgi:ETFB lysine methyltransferase
MEPVMDADESHGDGLVDALERRFAPVTVRARIGHDPIDLLCPPRPEELISEGDFARDERLPYWAELWPSALVLAEAVAAEAGHGRTLLELGCGLGLVSLAALRAGYWVMATDYYAEALAFTRANAWRVLGLEPQTRQVDWRWLPSDLGRYDRVVAADVLYERPYAAQVANTLLRTLADGGTATIADPGRIATRSFVEECRARHLDVLSAESRSVLEGNLHHQITLLTFRR